MPRRFTTQEFIKRAMIKHGNKYDYSLVNYVANNKKVRIICSIHGEFLQTPEVHYRCGGCRKCGTQITKRKLISSLEEFIEKARAIHGNKYDYSKAIYLNSVNKIEILCPLHGRFWQTPSLHLSESGCKECGRIKQGHHGLSLEDFINRSNVVHNYKFDYSNTIYKGNKLKLSIICPIHGVFFQRADSHLAGFGCSKCSNYEAGLKRIKNLTGQNFERLTVLKFYNLKKNDAYWTCQCKCGNVVVVPTSSLLSGNTRSCGCIQKEWTVSLGQSTKGTNNYMFGKGREKHPLWRFDLSQEERELSRNRHLLPETSQWRKQVYERDNYTCQLSGQKGGRLAAHHLVSWHSNKALRFDLNNGITLSDKVHKLFHNQYGNRNNTKEQFEEFKIQYHLEKNML